MRSEDKALGGQKKKRSPLYGHVGPVRGLIFRTSVDKAINTFYAGQQKLSSTQPRASCTVSKSCWEQVMKSSSEDKFGAKSCHGQGQQFASS